MEPKELRNFNSGPEAKIQKALIEFLEKRNWHVTVMHGNMYQQGIPDLYAVKSLGQPREGAPTQGIARWIEVKNALAFHFTRAQRENFYQWTSRGVGIWILTAATDEEYKKLFDLPNWTYYLIHPGRR